jgi:hypothetical protein
MSLERESFFPDTCAGDCFACDQGRQCDASHQATQAVISRFRLHEGDGGHDVVHEVSVRRAHVPPPPAPVPAWMFGAVVGIVASAAVFAVAVLGFGVRFF